MLEEEAEHLARGVGPLRVGVGAGGAAPRPGMAGALDHPLLEHRPATRVGVERAAVGPPAGCLPLLHGRRRLQVRCRGAPGLGDDLVAVARMDRRVPVAVEHDRRHDPPPPRGRSPAGRGPRGAGGSGSRPAPHGGESGGQVAGRADGEAGMHADGGVQVGVGRPHDGGGRPAGREPGDVDARRVDRVVGHDLAGDARDQRRLALVALLVAGAEPVPALRRVGGAGLRGVDDEAGVLLGERVHARAGGEVVGRLGAAVQHHHQGQRLPVVAAGHVELVGAAAGLVAVGPGEELGPVRHGLGCRRRKRRQPARSRPEAAAVEPLEEAAQRFGQVRLSRSAHLIPRPVACPGPDRLRVRRRSGLVLRALGRLGCQVDDAGAALRRCAGGVAGGAIRLAAEQAPQEGGGFGEPAGLDGAGRRQHVGAAWGLVHDEASLAWEEGERSRRELGEPRLGRHGVRKVASLRRLQPRGSGHLVRSANAALTAGLAWSAPKTTTEPMAARASSGVTSLAMLASPSTLMWSVSPAARAASRSSRL